MKKLGLDIEPHRRRMNESQPGLDEKFKDTDDPLRLVFVCAMWLTGFDAPSCSTVYLDKPMRNHTLMQTIARANRVFPGKHSGVIVDYANVFASLEKALAIYGAGKGGKSPVKDKAAAGRGAAQGGGDAATAFCAGHGVLLVEHRERCRSAAWSACSDRGRHERADLAGPAAPRLLRPRAAGGHALSRRQARPGGAGVRRAGGLHRDAGRRHPRQAEPEPAGHLGGDGRRSTTLLDESITGMTIRDRRPAGARPLEDQLRGARAAVQGVQAQEHRPRSAQGRHPRPSWRR